MTNKKSSIEADKKLNTKNKTEYKGFRLIITIEALTIKRVCIIYVEKIIFMSEAGFEPTNFRA